MATSQSPLANPTGDSFAGCSNDVQEISVEGITLTSLQDPSRLSAEIKFSDSPFQTQ